MSTAFFFFTVGYLVTLDQFTAPNLSQYLFRDLGDITSVIGLVVLVAAVSWD